MLASWVVSMSRLPPPPNQIHGVTCRLRIRDRSAEAFSRCLLGHAVWKTRTHQCDCSSELNNLKVEVTHSLRCSLKKTKIGHMMINVKSSQQSTMIVCFILPIQHFVNLNPKTTTMSSKQCHQTIARNWTQVHSICQCMTHSCTKDKSTAKWCWRSCQIDSPIFNNRAFQLMTMNVTCSR